MKKNGTLGAGGWMLGLVLSLLFSMVLGVALIWLSIDRNDTAAKAGGRGAQPCQQAGS